MKESTKKKLDSIDKSKIKVQESKDLLAKIEKALNNDKNEENQAKAEKLLDVFIAKAKAKNADIFKTEEPAKAKTPAQKKQVAQATKSKLDALMDTIANDPLFKDFNSPRRVKGGGRSDALIDSERKARESGRRVSQKGWKNQYGKSKGGRRYYEYRENRIDRKAPNYGSKPWLEDGGLIHPSDKFQEKYSVIEIKGDGSRKVHNTFPDFETAMVFASLKRNVMPSNTRIVVEDDKGTTMYRSFKSGGHIDESTAMVLSQNKAIAHHTEELKNALSKNPKVEPWVVGKIERASTDISDVTHYLDGRNEYAKGGYMADGGYVAYADWDYDNKLGVFKNKQSMRNFAIANMGKYDELIFEDESGDNIVVVKDDTKEDINSLFFSMAKGGEMADDDYEKGFDSEKTYLDEDDFAKIDARVEKEYLEKDRKSGVHDKFTKYWYNGGREKAIAKYGEDESKAWEEAYEDFKDDFYKRAKGGYMAEGGEIAHKIKRGDIKVGDKIYNAWFRDESIDGFSKVFIKADSKEEATRKAKVLDEKHFVKISEGVKNVWGKYVIDELKNDGTKIYAKGGYMADGGKIKWQDVYVGDNALVIAENKMGMVVKTYGRRFHLKFPDGSEKTYSAEELEFFKDEEYAKGGKTPTGDYTNRRNLHLIVIKNPNKSGSKDYLTIDKKDFLDGLHKFEDGGTLSKGYTYIKRADVNQVAYYDKNGKLQVDFKPKNGFWVSKKALVDAGMNQTKAKFDKNEVAKELIELSNKAWDKLSIQSGSEIYASDTLQQDLADEYQNLGINKIYKQLTKAERKKVSDVLTDENEHSLRNYLALRGYNGEAEYKNYVQMFEDGKAKYGYTSNWNPKNVDFSIGAFAKGGKIGFEGLSNKVAKNYEGKKVAPKYRKEYGETYDKEEAKEVGDKVASKVYRQQLAKMEKGGKLPEDLGKYFIKTRKTKMVKMSDLKPLRARPTGIENAEKYMRMAYEGKMEKRKPITIYKSQGKYRVYDGNSTYAVAKANGWENIWAEVVKNPNMNTYAKRSKDIFTIAKEIRKEGEAWKDALQRAKAMK